MRRRSWTSSAERAERDFAAAELGQTAGAPDVLLLSLDACAAEVWKAEHILCRRCGQARMSKRADGTDAAHGGSGWQEEIQLEEDLEEARFSAISW